MKKFILVSVLVAMTAGTVMSQAIKVDPDAIMRKIERSNADIENPKKNNKSATWLDRGKIFQEAATASWNGLYRGITIEAVQLLYGNKVEPTAEVIGGIQYEVYDYPNFTGYFDDGLLSFWKPKLTVIEDAYTEAMKSYEKAYEVDPRAAAKVKAAIDVLANEHKKEAENGFGLQDYGLTADHFARAYEVQMHPAVGEVDTNSVYNAGMFYTFSGDFEKGAKYLELADQYDYHMDGDVYYFLYHSYYGQDLSDKAKDILTKGISLYPSNTKIVEGLIGIYSVTESDPKEIVDIVKKSIDAEPDNHLLWGGLGGIYQKMDEFDEAIAAYQKAVSLAPDDFFNQFRLAYAYIELSDEYNKRLNEMTPSSSDEYNNALEKVYLEYEKALEPLERAHEIDPSNEATIELLKNLTFRLRDRDDSIMQKYEKYNALFQSL
ncbi:MAG: tetratricopeptide repeat protein [Alistipes sp.]|nr:tetratricopeptide repeat protein [Alistipes sp.]